MTTASWVVCEHSWVWEACRCRCWCCCCDCSAQAQHKTKVPFCAPDWPGLWGRKRPVLAWAVMAVVARVVSVVSQVRWWQACVGQVKEVVPDSVV